MSSSVAPFSFSTQSFPALGSFPMSWLFTWHNQRIPWSFRVSINNSNELQCWFPLGMTGLSRVFSSTTVSKHQKLWNPSHLPLQQKEQSTWEQTYLRRQKSCIQKNDKTLMKEIKDNINRWRDIPCSWVERINIVKMSTLPNAIYRFSVIPIKLPVAIFTELQQKISQFIWKHRWPQIVKAVSRKKNRAGEINLHDFRLYYKATSSRQYGTGKKTEI